jgi:hypothetical protein
MNILDKLAEINPISIPGLIKMAEGEKEESVNSVESFGNETAEASAGFVVSLVLIITIGITLGVQYMSVKCYCGNFLHYFLFGIFLCCCPLCAVPYIAHQYFGKKCGRGQIGKPNVTN